MFFGGFGWGTSERSNFTPLRGGIINCRIVPEKELKKKGVTKTDVVFEVLLVSENTSGES